MANADVFTAMAREAKHNMSWEVVDPGWFSNTMVPVISAEITERGADGASVRAAERVRAAGSCVLASLTEIYSTDSIVLLERLNRAGYPLDEQKAAINGLLYSGQISTSGNFWAKSPNPVVPPEEYLDWLANVEQMGEAEN